MKEKNAPNELAAGEQTPFKMPKHMPAQMRVPVEPDNPAIVRYSSMCFNCGNCKWTCLDHCGVSSRYDLAQTGDMAICTYCGQCVNECPGFAMTEREEYQTVIQAIKDSGKVVIASTSPAVRVSIGEEFGVKGEFNQGKLVAMLKKLGFDYVLDTNFGADLTVMEESHELLRRLTEGGPLPQFTSCCPSWVRFAELFYPKYLQNISCAKSPIAMQGAIIKTWFAKKMNIDPAKIVNVAVAPCTAKKYEIRREGMNAAGSYLGTPEMADMDNVITTRELAKWAKEAEIDFAGLEAGEFDSMNGSGAGAIFGSTGGVMEAALRTGYSVLNDGKNPPADFFELKPVRGLASVREAEIDLGKMKINVAVIFGTQNASEFIEKMEREGKTYHFVEVMSCPGGCSGGGGQPKGFVIKGCKPDEERIAALYDRDKSMPLRLSHENSEIKALYDEFLGAPDSELARRLLHTEYFDRSAELKAQEV